MWLVAVNAVGRVVVLTPEQASLPFEEMQHLPRIVGPIFTAAHDNLEDAEFFARLSWARWILSGAPAAEALRSSHQPSQAASVLGAILDSKPGEWVQDPRD